MKKTDLKTLIEMGIMLIAIAAFMTLIVWAAWSSR